jgi:hypothetical protein
MVGSMIWPCGVMSFHSNQVIWEVGSQKGDYYVVYDPSDFGDERAVWKAAI